MSFPRLRASLGDDRAAARVLERALRHERGIVPLTSPVEHGGTHVLEIAFSGGKVVEVLVEPVGPGGPDGQPLDLRPVSQSQMAEIFALIERLDAPVRLGAYSSLPARPATVPPKPLAATAASEIAAPGTGPSPARRPGAYVLVADEPEPEPEPDDDEPTLLRQAASRAETLAPPPPTETPEETIPPSSRLRSTGPEAFSATLMPSDLDLSAGPADSFVPPPSSSVPARRISLPAAPVSSSSLPIVERSPDSESGLIGRVIGGKYEIVSSIGRGASAEVFRAEHVTLKRPVAVKILHQENQGSEQFVKRFKAEGRTLSRLEHQNIARVIDFGEDPGGLLYLVMEMITGKSLEFLIWAGGTLPVPKVLDVAMQACSALAFAHDEGIVHRDVKPENILLVPHKDDDGEPCEIVKVCDFGLAKLQDPDAESADLTMRGAVCGSPAYMSPEQIRGEALDARTDIYSLAITLYEALTGKYPHDAIGLTDLFAKKLMAEPTPLRTHLPDIDPGLEATIMRAMSREPEDRQADARALRKELRAALKAQKDD
ncbi:MAG TPA: serine/threonine-protein kinase [Polyangiaceae bacterium]|nr:serine/threonine-protein kinase [Polyangiaceae bacterium]